MRWEHNAYARSVPSALTAASSQYTASSQVSTDRFLKEMWQKHRKRYRKNGGTECLQIRVTELSAVTWPSAVNAEEDSFCLPGWIVSVRRIKPLCSAPSCKQLSRLRQDGIINVKPHIHMRVHTCTHKRTHESMHTQAYILVHTNTCIWACVCMHTQVYN